ncbi:glycosyltransferase [Acidipropionibacterium jensenii]|uniref:glycosyltransferase n=1 Tax=Acidipropionibacterium jensenii TaxID=1749 RepID=UPI00214AA1C1|nr:glycosyltransferase [Acidipropionibacterium jensenii]
MPSATSLFLLTSFYPLSTGEEFIENEIGHLAHAFDRVIVVATQTSPTDVITRAVPSNVEVIAAGGALPSGLAALKEVLPGLSQLPREALSGDAARNPRILALDAMFENHAHRIADALAAELPGLRLAPGSHAVIYSFWFHVQARLAMLLAADLRSRGVVVDRIVSRAHRYDLYEGETKYGHIPERKLLLGALDGVYPVSEQGSRELRRRWPAFADKIHTRHLGTVDPGEQAVCARSPFHLVSCSNLVPVKRVDRLPVILAGLRSRGIDVVWTHLGDGPQMDAVREAVERAGVGEWTDLRGHVPNTEVLDVERALNPSCFINLSSSEGLPVSMMEVAALGIPILATDVGGVAEIVHDGVNGKLLPAEFTDAQAVDALAWLAGLDADAFQAARAASRQVWAAGFDQAKVYPAFCAEVLGAEESQD